MISFFNTFLSYLLLLIIFLCIIVAAFFIGKKLREAKDRKDSHSDETASKEEIE